MRRLTVAIVLVAVVAGAACAEEAATDRFQKVADRMVAAMSAGDWAAVQTDFAPVMRNAMPREKSDPFFKGLVAQYGKVQGLGAPRFVPPATAVFAVRFERGTLDMKVVLDPEDKITGLWFAPHAPDIPVPEKHETPLALPFKGRWLTFWGGDTREVNQHRDAPNQRYAFDFLGVGPDGKTHKGDGKANEDYYAFGREVLAPADGAVTDVIDGVRDNAPGSMNPYSAVGNCIVIEHRPHEVSVLAHLKLGSVRVKPGEKVKAGQVIGLCGNSGNSSEPHLHYHLQNTPVLQDGTGIKVRFQKVSLVKDGRTQAPAECSPVKGDVVEAP